MAEGLLSKEELIKLEKEKKKNGPRWFLLSYDAGEEIRQEKLNERKEKVIFKYRKYGTDDFRKTIIRTLKLGEVKDMEEPVETTILFLDPRTNRSYDNKLNFWNELFKKYESDFYYIIAPAIQYAGGEALYEERPNNTLNANFQKLVKQVLTEKKPS